jgi:restriction endonuclease S subunit
LQLKRRKEIRYETPLYPLIKIGDLAEFIQYGISERANLNGAGVPMIRMNNLQPLGWDFSDLKHIELDEAALKKHRLEPGDILFNRTNSKELVGKCEVFNEPGDWVFASYLIRVRLDRSTALPEFVSAFLNTEAGRMQIDQVSRQIAGMSNVNAEELRELEVPLPPLTIQRKIIDELEQARVHRDSSLSEAAALDASLDAYLMERLGVKVEDQDSRKVFAVRRSHLNGARIDAPAYQPLLARDALPSAPIMRLQECVVINGNSVPRPTSDETLVPYVGLPECDQTTVREVVLRPYKEVKGRSILKPGDVLFARIEPSIFNKKYVLVDDLFGHKYAYTSTEFYVVTPIEGVTIAEYVHAMFFCSFVYLQSRGMTTGSSGRRRLDAEQFRALKFPLASIAEQNVIVAETMRRRTKGKELRSHAEALWRAARERFEDLLLNGVTS